MHIHSILENLNMKQTLVHVKGEIHNSARFVHSTSITGPIIIQIISNENWHWNLSLDETNLTYTHRTFNPKAAEYTFFSSAYAALSTER